ncbi:MAG: Ig-like domain-containing protein [Bacilli bacterium]|nr:Ig-like domain-containing protein [Bacilli bacterium]
MLLLSLGACSRTSNSSSSSNSSTADTTDTTDSDTSTTVAVTGISLDSTSLSLEVGDTYTLTATVTPSDATDSSVTWSSSNKKVATVSNGLITAKGTGSATITAKAGNYTATCKVTVSEASSEEVSVTGVSLSSSSLSLEVGDTSTLTATVTPSNATDSSVSWSSSNTSVATVSSSGKVSAIAAGSATITVTTTDGSYTDTCAVTVTEAGEEEEETQDGVYDTDGNEITSGSASVSFVYNNQTTKKTISAAYLIDGVTVNISSGEYASASGSSDQVIFLVVNGGTLNIIGTSSSYVSLSKSGSAASSGQVDDDYNFYGVNSGIVVSGSASSATIQYANISTTSNGSNAVVATNGGSIDISDSVITTSGSAGSRGLHTTYDGDITADNVEITTQGKSCASLANDRGGGSIVASNMTLETNANGSPLVYSTDSITVSESTGSANGAQMVVVEGGSSADLTNCDFSCTGAGNRTGTSDSNSSEHTIDAGGIFIYQSVSGDSEEGTDYFTASGCTFEVTNSGVPMFYLTNITAVVTLSNNTFTQKSSSDYLMMAEATDQWGSSGSNGATVTVKLTNQTFDTTKTYVGSTSSITYK